MSSSGTADFRVCAHVSQRKWFFLFYNVIVFTGRLYIVFLYLVFQYLLIRFPLSVTIAAVFVFQLHHHQQTMFPSLFLLIQHRSGSRNFNICCVRVFWSIPPTVVSKTTFIFQAKMSDMLRSSLLHSNDLLLFVWFCITETRTYPGSSQPVRQRSSASLCSECFASQTFESKICRKKLNLPGYKTWEAQQSVVSVVWLSSDWSGPNTAGWHLPHEVSWGFSEKEKWRSLKVTGNCLSESMFLKISLLYYYRAAIREVVGMK